MDECSRLESGQPQGSGVRIPPVPLGFHGVADVHGHHGDWTFANYELDAPEDPAIGFWIGLSEITMLPNGNVAIVERDNQIGPLATTKKLYGVDLSVTEFLPDRSTPNTVEKMLIEDLLDELDEVSIMVTATTASTRTTARPSSRSSNSARDGGTGRRSCGGRDSRRSGRPWHCAPHRERSMGRQPVPFAPSNSAGIHS